MKIRLLLALLLLAVVLAGVSPGLAQTGQEPKTPRLVTLDLKDVPLAEAIRRVVAATDLSVIIAGELPQEPRVTMRLKDSDPVEALAQLSMAGQLQCIPVRSDHPTVLIYTYPEGQPGRMVGRPAGAPQPKPSAAPEPPASSLNQYLGGLIVDLNAKDMPLRDVIARLMEQIPSQGPLPLPVSIVVDESVSKDIRVTARLSKMSMSWVLDSLLAQAGLTSAVRAGPYTAGSPPLVIIYIVPKPELQVSSGKPG